MLASRVRQQEDTVHAVWLGAQQHHTMLTEDIRDWQPNFHLYVTHNSKRTDQRLLMEHPMSKEEGLYTADQPPLQNHLYCVIVNLAEVPKICDCWSHLCKFNSQAGWQQAVDTCSKCRTEATRIGCCCCLGTLMCTLHDARSPCRHTSQLLQTHPQLNRVAALLRAPCLMTICYRCFSPSLADSFTWCSRLVRWAAGDACSSICWQRHGTHTAAESTAASSH